MDFLEKIKKELVPNNFSMTITICIILIILISSKIGAKNMEKLTLVLIPTITSPYFYKELKKRNIKDFKIMQILAIFYSCLILLFIDFYFFGLPTINIANNNINLMFPVMIISAFLISFNKSKIKYFRNKKNIGIIMLFLWLLIYIIPIFNKIIFIKEV